MTASGGQRYPAQGEVIDGKYRIDRMLGEGGMGAVAGAFHLLRKAPVALKFISPDVVRVPGAVDRFVNEAVAASQIDSDHVVRIFDVGQLPTGLPYIVMEMMQGCDLSELLEREGAQGGFPVPRAVHFVLQILRALQVAHAAGIVHRDLKPSNAFVVVKDGEGDFVKILDFGISKITQDVSESQQHLTQTNTGLGTPLYMSPEQARNARDATAQSDLYSVSAILYELLTGRTPYMANSPNDLLFKLFTSEPDPIRTVRPDIPQGLADVVHRGLSKEAEARPASAGDYAELLAPFADGRSSSILSRIRAAASGRSSNLPDSRLSPMASTTAPAARGLDRTALADPSVAAQTASTPRKTGGTQLNMGVSEPLTVAQAPAPKRTGMFALLGVAAFALLGGGAFLATRAAMPTQARAPATAATEPAPRASSEPSAVVVTPVKSATPEVAPAVTSAPVEQAAPPSAEPKRKAPPPGPAVEAKPPPPPQKKSPFNVGIVQ